MTKPATTKIPAIATPKRGRKQSMRTLAAPSMDEPQMVIRVGNMTPDQLCHVTALLEHMGLADEDVILNTAAAHHFLSQTVSGNA